jgi:hypothetical protein
LSISTENVATIFDYAGVKDFVAGLFEGPVDVIDRMFEASSSAGATADTVRAF